MRKRKTGVDGRKRRHGSTQGRRGRGGLSRKGQAQSKGCERSAFGEDSGEGPEAHLKIGQIRLARLPDLDHDGP